MSKLTKLKQQAYQAGKSRNWEQAVAIYEDILEIDKNNPTLINELGDICLKTGDTERAIRYFLNAASKYRGTGLLNNAVAIYKKILRHDSGNLNAHWYLAEIRSSQGLTVDGERHALKFLEASEGQRGNANDILKKRCEQLLSLYPRSTGVLERLLGIYRMWDLTVEQGRTQILLAILQLDGGDAAAARKEVSRLLEQMPELSNYAEYTRWCHRSGEDAAPAAPQSVNDPGAIDLGTAAGPPSAAAEEIVAEDAGVKPHGEGTATSLDSVSPVAAPAPEVRGEAAIGTVAERPPSSTVGEWSFGDIAIQPRAGTATPTPPPPASPPTAEAAPDEPRTDELPPDEQPAVELSAAGPPADELPTNEPPAAGTPADEPPTDVTTEEEDEEGRFNIDLDDATSFADIMADLESETSASEPAEPPADTAAGSADADSAAAEDTAAVDAGASEPDDHVDLLAAILAETGDELIGAAEKQVETIATEIGQRVGRADEGAARRPYDLGLVYLEMGMSDLACEQFAAAVESGDRPVSAHEMWGIALLDACRVDEAQEVLDAGLRLPVDRPDERLGLLYHAARAHEEAGDTEGARDLYVQAYQIQNDFLDIADRIRALSAV